EQPVQKLDDWSDRLRDALPAMLTYKGQQLEILSAKLQPRLLLAEMKTAQQRITDWQKRMHLACQRRMETGQERVNARLALLESLNYQRVLERGFILARDAKGKLIASAKQASASGELSLTFKDGEIAVKVKD